MIFFPVHQIQKYLFHAILAIVLFSCSLLLIPSLSNHAFAEGVNTSELFQNVNPDVPKDIHTISHVVMIDVLSSLTCQLGGIDPTRKDGKCLGVDRNTGKIGFVKKSDGGFVGVLETMIVTTFTLPTQIHTSDYFAYVDEHFGFTKKAYAQSQKNVGIGFVGISPLLTTWVNFRNIVYLLFVVIFIIVGIGIMLRVKIDPRTVMTIENQLPKIIIGLLLVSFSFAIAGFLIDFMWVFIFVIINLLTNIDKNIDPAGVTSTIFGHPIDFFSRTWDNGIWGFAGAGFGAVFNTIQNIFTPQNWNQLQVATGANNQGCGFLDFGCWAASIFPLILKGIFTLGSFILAPIIYLIFLIAIIVILIRIWWTLIKAYLSILVAIVLGPFWIALGILPGSTLGFVAWLRFLTANLLSFPAAIFMFLLARVLADSLSNPTNVFVPPLIGNPNAADFTGNHNFVPFIITLVMLSLIPTVDRMLKDALKSSENKYVGPALIAGVGAGGRFVGGSIRESIGSYTAYQFDPLDLRYRGPAGAVGRVFSRWFR